MKSKKGVVLELSLTIVFLLTGVFAAVSVADAAAASGRIDEAGAKEIALAHAGLKESDVDFIRVRLDYDDGRQEYEVEFYRGNVEYDYDIDALTGEIVSYERSSEPTAISAHIMPEKDD